MSSVPPRILPPERPSDERRMSFIEATLWTIGSVVLVVSCWQLVVRAAPAWKDDAGMKAWNEFLDKYFPEANRSDSNVMYGYTVAQGLVHVLKQCGDNLTRENVMRQAASLKDVKLPLTLPGIVVDTSPEDFRPIVQLRMLRFDGKRWNYFGPLVTER